MIIFLHGEDGYRLEQAQREIIDKYQAKHASGLNLFVFDGAAADAAARLEESLKGLSFFDEVKLVVMKNALASDREAVARLLERFNLLTDSRLVILATHSGPLDKKPNSLAKILIDKKNLVRSFEPLAGARLSAWLKSEAAKRQISFSPSALKLFLEIAGTDNWMRINNLEKLANYLSAGQGRPISNVTEKAILTLIASPASSNLFDFIDALGRRERPKAYELLYRELGGGAEPYSILTMIAYQFRTMLIIKDLDRRGLNSTEISKQSGLHPFVVRKTIPNLAKLELSELIRRFQNVQKLELAAKSGRIDLTDGLFALALAG